MESGSLSDMEERNMNQLHFEGIVIAAATIIIIGLFHPIVIKTEYYFGCGVWPVFLAAGLFLIGLSLIVEGTVPCVLLAVTGASCLWSIHELFQQRERVRKGWWPKNPKRGA